MHSVCRIIGWKKVHSPFKFVSFPSQACIFPLLFIILQVSSGALDRACSLMKRILELCNTPLEQGSEAMKAVQQRSFHSVARHLVKEVISSNENVRKQV